MYWGWDATGKKKQTTHNKKLLISFLRLGNVEFGFLGICDLKYIVKGADDAQKSGFVLSSYT